MTIHIDTTYKLIPPYVVMIVLACAIGIAMQYIMNRKRGIDKKIAGFVALLSPFMSFFFGFLLTYVSSGGKSFGLSSIGGLVGMYGSVLTLALIVGDKEQSRVMFENCTLALPLMYSVSKLGCLFAGCCHGRPYSGPFSIEYTGKVTETGGVFPVQLSETVVFFLIFAAGVIMFAKGSKSAVSCQSLMVDDISRSDTIPAMDIRTDDVEKTEEVLEAGGYSHVNPADIYRL